MKYRTPQIAYEKYREDPARFFDDVIHAESSDESTLISASWPPSWTRYHYNLVENGIIRMLRGAGIELDESSQVLDIGIGTGHWLDFYREVLGASHIVGVDFSERAIERVGARLAHVTGTTLHHGDVCVPRPAWHDRFTVVNAIGVMFHIVDDDAWARAVHNIGRYLTDDGIAIVGGDFGEETRERGVMRRTRSIAAWRELLTSEGLQEHSLERYDWWAGADSGGITDNLLSFKRA